MAKTPVEKPEAKQAEASAGTPTTTPAAKVKKAKVPISVSPSFLSFIVAVLALGYLIFASWVAFQPPATSEVTQTAVATPTLPVLKLNQDNKRQAPEITVDQNGIGKTDPFK